MQKIILIIIAVVLFSIAACDQPTRLTFLYETDRDIRELARNNTPVYPDMEYIVFSDPHYFAPELGTSGGAFDKYLHQDRKMLKESSEIMRALVEGIDEHFADFVIVCGDLTKDGELASHQQCASLLADIRAQGKRVYVVPGNHDISNGEAMSFVGDVSQRVPTVDPDTFRAIYADFGYGEAVATDPDSLSYIVEPVPGLWLFGLDSCRYRENPQHGHPITGGKLYSATLDWIEQQLIEAIYRQKAVIGFLHHGMLEHYPGNEKHFSDYLLEDFEPIGKMFAAYGMRFVFTGHYHAQDITHQTWVSSIPNHFLCDVETGSLVTYPVPWRHIAVNDQRMTITSHSIRSIESRPDDFPLFAELFVLDGMTGVINAKLTEYGVPESDQELLTPQISRAYVTHLQGDERRPVQYLDFSGVSPTGVMVGLVQGDLIRGWYTDLPPEDNNLTIDMETGQVP
jgi:3',5'-cyclic AMP phosphodiesterase CpdA